MKIFPLHLRTFAIGTLGGLIGYLLNLPLGWLVGSMLATVPCAMAGVRMPMALHLRIGMIGIVGLTTGGAFKPEIFQHISSWTFSVAGLVLYCLVTSLIGLVIGLRICRFDRVTAALAVAPGGLSEILVIGPMHGADMRLLTLIHGARILLILLVVPFLVIYWGPSEGPLIAIRRSLDFSIHVPAIDMAILTFCLVAGIYLARTMRLPAAPLVGPLILSAIAHSSGLTSFNLPQPVLYAAQIVIGASVAQFFPRTALRHLLIGLLVGSVLIVVSLAIAIAFAFALQQWLDIPFSLVLMALVPGGLSEMSLVTIALGMDVAFVSLHHLVRIILVLTILPTVIARWGVQTLEITEAHK